MTAPLISSPLTMPPIIRRKRPGALRRPPSVSSAGRPGFPLLYTYLVLEGIISLERLVEMLADKPASLFGLDTGVLEPGREADLAIIDPEASFVIDVEDFHSKGRNTPFKGYRCRGKILRTFVAGREAMPETQPGPGFSRPEL